MIFDHGNKSVSASSQGRELHRLKRQDLLELLLEQMRENDALRAAAEEDQATITRLTERSDDLKARLDGKDALLKDIYDNIRTLTEASTQAQREHAALQLEDLFVRHFLDQTGEVAE